jgi:hypothetical protein
MATSVSFPRILPMALLCLGVLGCSFSLDLRGGALVNPEDPLREEAPQNSRELSIRIYQLHRQDNLTQVLAIPWESFSGSEIPEGLKPFLAVSADTPPQLRPPEDFFIRRQQHKRIRFKLAKGASALLVVARGRRPGDTSLQLVQLGPLDRVASLCFYKYDVFQDSHTWPCAGAESSAGE